MIRERRTCLDVGAKGGVPIDSEAFKKRQVFPRSDFLRFSYLPPEVHDSLGHVQGVSSGKS